jgi:hypothetical protein
VTSSGGNGATCLRTSGELEIRRGASVVMWTRTNRIFHSGSRQSTALELCDIAAGPWASRATAITCARCFSSSHSPLRWSASMNQPRRI